MTKYGNKKGKKVKKEMMTKHDGQKILQYDKKVF